MPIYVKERKRKKKERKKKERKKKERKKKEQQKRKRKNQRERKYKQKQKKEGLNLIPKFAFQVCDETIALDVDEDEGDDEALSSDPDRPHDMGVEKTDQVSCHILPSLKILIL